MQFFIKKNNLSPCSNGILSSRHFAWNGFMNFLIEKLEPYLSIHDQQFVLIKINTEPKALGFLPTWNITNTSQKPDTIQTIQGPYLSTVQSGGKKNKSLFIYVFIFLYIYRNQFVFFKN